jgi:hypothetical protein
VAYESRHGCDGAGQAFRSTDTFGTMGTDRVRCGASPPEQAARRKTNGTLRSPDQSGNL